MKTSNEEKAKEPTIKVIMGEDGEFYYAPLKTRGVIVREVPVWIFEGYVEHKMKLRDIKDNLKSYFENSSI